MTLKSLHFTNAWHATSGGIGTFYRALLEAAERRRHPMRLVVPGERDDLVETGEFGRIYYLRAPRAIFNREYRFINPNHYLPGSGKIRQILQAERPDLVEINDKYTLNYLGGLLRERWIKQVKWRPTVIGLSCERMDENMAAYLSPSRLAQRFVHWYMKWIYFGMFDHHIANSQHTAAELAIAARGHKVRRGVWIGPMGVDFKLFSSRHRDQQSRRELEAKCNAGPGTTLLLYAGRLVREKNLNLLIETMNSVDQQGSYRLLMAGSGDLRESLEAHANERTPGRVCFLGHISDRAQLAKLYHCADVFVHPNPKEPFGIAPLEAMAAGLPLVAPDSGGLTVYANESNAWLASPQPRAFAAAIQSVTADPEERCRRITAARNTAAAYSWERATDFYLDLYQDLHAITQRAREKPRIDPLFYSTLGDNWGREIEDGASLKGSYLNERTLTPS